MASLSDDVTAFASTGRNSRYHVSSQCLKLLDVIDVKVKAWRLHVSDAGDAGNLKKWVRTCILVSELPSFGITEFRNYRVGRDILKA